MQASEINTAMASLQELLLPHKSYQIDQWEAFAWL